MTEPERKGDDWEVNGYLFGCRGSAQAYAQAVDKGVARDDLMRPCIMVGKACGMLHVVVGLVE